MATGEVARSRFFRLAYVVPALAVLLWVIWPLISGSHTLYLRDVLNAHLEKKWVQAEAMADGYLPLLDPHRDGGQPLAGNPNSVAFYPDNLLLYMASPLWVLNAHFWLHLLIAPFSVFWLARVWGLRREAAWAAGLVFTTGGFFLSMLNLYNMVAGVALTPAFVAAMIELSERSRRASRLLAATLLWSLLLLGGDPMIAAMALVLAVSAVLVRWGWKGISWRWTLIALGLGVLLALPQLVEFARILPLTYRGHQGFSAEAATVGSWNPWTALELLVPFAFGKPDLVFWGRAFFSGTQPLLVTLYPGVVALWLVLVGARSRRRVAWWAWGLVVVGLFFVLGSYNPVVALLWKLPGASLLRLPIKFWLLVAMGGALLAGLGFERLLERDAEDHAAGRLLGGVAVVFLTGWILLSALAPMVNGWLRQWIPATFPAEMVDHERLRWAGLCLFSLIALAVSAVWLRLGRRWPVGMGSGLLMTHLIFQLVVLRPAIAIDEVTPYFEPSPLLDLIPEGSVVVYGKDQALFGAPDLPLSEYPDYRTLWLQRQVYHELYPAAGIVAGRDYAFSVSPEGLDSFLTRAVGQSLRSQSDVGRLRLLAASGVEFLLLDRDLEGDVSALVEKVDSRPTVGGEILVYRLLQPAAEFEMVGTVRRAPHLNAALTWMVADDFDPLTETVLPQGGEASSGPAGSVEVIASGPEAVELEVEAPAPGALVVQRTFLPLYRATIDGDEVPIVAANIHRLGVEVPAGVHEVRIWVDRRPLRLSSAIAVIGLVLVLWLSWRLRSSFDQRATAAAD